MAIELKTNGWAKFVHDFEAVKHFHLGCDKPVELKEGSNCFILRLAGNSATILQEFDYSPRRDLKKDANTNLTIKIENYTEHLIAINTPKQFRQDKK